ncbi:MAG: tripartite tricarboxylate transporter substrate binding protein [Betaproteobacteria bacterium]|nr:tripartite tricarboxylate transporter substrate binding protein [Betaproteobacteria bacterium]
MFRFLRVIFSGLAAALCVLTSNVVPAQSFPLKTIRMILPFPPGGPTDLLGRSIAQKLADQFGHQVIADNRPGAGGNLGLEVAAKSPPDGYTIVLSSPLIALGPLLYSRLNYDPFRDLAPISLVAVIQNILLVHPSVPAKTLKELIQVARRSPGKLNYGSGGVGTTTHLAPELLKSLAKINMVHVPYKGSGLALIGLIGGDVDLLIMAVPASAAQVQAGKVRALAVLSTQRAAALPDVPTTKEAGVENLEVPIWYGILTAAATPRDIITRLNTELTKALTSADLKERLTGAGIEPMTSTPEQFGNFIRSENVRFAKVIKDAGIKPE